jgi:hypothetical protein
MYTNDVMLKEIMKKDCKLTQKCRSLEKSNLKIIFAISINIRTGYEDRRARY